MPRLLISVRDPEEAEAALAGGADLIDVKEPAGGALGKAADDVLRAVVRQVDGRAPVSAALGEWDEGFDPPAGLGLAFVKWGCARAGRDRAAWVEFLKRKQEREGPRFVFVAYADWECAQAPPLEEIVRRACERSGATLLIDTHCKDDGRSQRRPTLLEWLSPAEAEEICATCHAAGVRVALAGSLGPGEMALLQPACPDWFALRGAACGGDRQGRIQESQVRRLAALAHADAGAVSIG